MKNKILFLIILLFAGFAIPAEAQDINTATAGIGVGGIKVGKSTRSDVIKKFGKDFKTEKHGRYSYQLKYDSGVSFYFCQVDEKQVIFVIEMRAPFKVKTNKGITLSKSTVDDVKKAYGKSKAGLQYRGIEFYHADFGGKQVVSVIDIVETGGLRQCKENK